MSKTPKPNEREDRLVGAILWARSENDQVAPDGLGGQTAAEQERIVREHIEDDDRELDRILFGIGTHYDSSDERLRFMLQMLEQVPVSFLYIAGEVYANDSEDERMKHHVLLLMHGVMLTICESD